MAVVANDQVFSIPFRFLWSTNLAGELDLEDQRPTGLARFVGDDENKILRILIDEPTTGFSDKPSGIALAIGLIRTDRYGKNLAGDEHYFRHCDSRKFKTNSRQTNRNDCVGF